MTHAYKFSLQQVEKKANWMQLCSQEQANRVLSLNVYVCMSERVYACNVFVCMHVCMLYLSACNRLPKPQIAAFPA